MKKHLIFMAALAFAGAAFAGNGGKTAQIRFSELPFAEGKLFVSVAYGDTTILAKAVEVESDTVMLPADLSAYCGKELQVQAFQDLNDNNTLDFDNYGRPTEPCLRTVVIPEAEQPEIGLKLVQY